MITYDQLYDLLDIAKEKDDEYDFHANCPVHGGSDSLHVWIDESGDLGVHCLSCGASIKEVGRALGLFGDAPDEDEDPEDDLPRVSIRRRGGEDPKPAGKRVKWSDYAEAKQLDLKVLGLEGSSNEDVVFVFPSGAQKIRLDTHFVWEGGKAKDNLLWPAIEGWDELPDTVYITEGETDMYTLRQQGFCAFAITTGANAKGVLTTEHYVALKKRGVRTVILVPDGDPAGRGWRLAEVAIARDALLNVGVIDLTSEYDPFGFGIKDVNELWLDCEDADEFLERLERLTYIEAPRESLDIARIAELAEEEVQYLIPDLVSPNEKGLIVGRAKTYKTWLALDLMRSICTGQSFLNSPEWTPEETYPVLLVEEEGSRTKFARRVMKVFEGHDEPPFHLWFRHGMNLTVPSLVDNLIKYIREHGIKLVVLDPLQRMMPGIDENDNTKTAEAWDAIHRIAAECAIIVIHHANKQGEDWRNAIRGASRVEGEIDFVLYVQQGTDDEKIKVHVDGRDLERIQEMDGYLSVSFDHPAQMEASGWKVNVGGASGRQGARSRAKIEDALAAHPKGLNLTALQKVVGLANRTVEKHIQAMLEGGRVVKLNGKYVLMATEEEDGDGLQ